MNHLLKFEFDGNPVFVEVEESETEGMRPVNRGEDGVQTAEIRFTEAVARIRPAAEAVLKSLREMNTPDEIGLEFGIKLDTKVGAVFASANSAVNFKISLKWKNERAV